MTRRSMVDEAADPDTPFRRLLQLSKSNNVKVRRALVDNPSIAVDESGSVTRRILFNLAIEFPDEVARSPSFALFGLELKDRLMFRVVHRIARKAKDRSIMDLIFQEFRHYEGVRENFALNKNAPKEVLRMLGNKDAELSAWVRQNVARNPCTPEDVLRILENPKTEPEKMVRNAAYEALKKRGLR